MTHPRRNIKCYNEKALIAERNGILKGTTRRLVLSIWTCTLRKGREGAHKGNNEGPITRRRKPE